MRLPVVAGTLAFSTTYSGDGPRALISARIRAGGMRERAGQRGGDCGPLRRGHLRRVGEDQVGLQGHGQHLAVAGGDGAAYGRD